MYNFPLNGDKPDQTSGSSKQGSCSAAEGPSSGPVLTNLCLLVDVTAAKLKRVGRYNLGRVVGRGAFGIVRLGQNTQTGFLPVCMHGVLMYTVTGHVLPKPHCRTVFPQRSHTSKTCSLAQLCCIRAVPHKLLTSGAALRQASVTYHTIHFIFCVVIDLTTLYHVWCACTVMQKVPCRHSSSNRVSCTHTRILLPSLVPACLKHSAMA